MLGRSFSFCCVLGLAFTLAAGCKKSEPEQKAAQSAQTQSPPFTNAAPGELIARIHWLGKKRLATDINAAPFMGIWNMPESEKLEKQTLDKLALAPWDLPRSGTNLASMVATNSASALLRPLLDDLVQEESYLEIRSTSDGGTSVPASRAAQTVLAIHLDDQRDALWKTNVAALLPSLSTNQYSQITNPSLSRAGQWTILTFGDAQNPLAQHISARIQHNGAPVAANLTNYWVDAQLDLERLLLADTNAAITWPTNVNLTVIGDGKNVITRSELDFAQPLPVELEPWNIPTNLIHDPLIGFSALRGFRPFLKSFKPWNDLQLGTPPNQSIFWARAGAPSFHFVAAPSQEASNQVYVLSTFALQNLNPIFQSNVIRIGEFERKTNSAGIFWHGLPIILPNLDYVNTNDNSFIVAEFAPNHFTNRPPPPELFAQLNGSELIWYDWEITQPCLDGLTTIGQLVRRLFNRATMTGDTLAVHWMLAPSLKLGNSATAVKMLSPAHFSFSRSSTIGFTAVELELICDWLESPRFPYGFYSSLTPAPVGSQAPSIHSITLPSNPPQPNANAPRQPPTNSPPEPKKP